MNRKYYNDFNEKYKEYYKVLHENLSKDMKDKLIGKTVGVYLEPEHIAGGLGNRRTYPFKIFKLKDIVLDSRRNDYFDGNRYFFISDNDMTYSVPNPFTIINVDEILNDFNSKQPEVTFNKEIIRKLITPSKKSIFNRILKKIENHFKYNPTRELFAISPRVEQVIVNLKNISYFTDVDGEDKFKIIDIYDNEHIMINPIDISIIIRNENDPYGEENWDD